MHNVRCTILFSMDAEGALVDMLQNIAKQGIAFIGRHTHDPRGEGDKRPRCIYRHMCHPFISLFLSFSFFSPTVDVRCRKRRRARGYLSFLVVEGVRIATAGRNVLNFRADRVGPAAPINRARCQLDEGRCRHDVSR